MLKRLSVCCCRCWLLSCEAGHDVHSTADWCERAAGLQGGQEEQDYSRYCAALLFTYLYDTNTGVLHNSKWAFLYVTLPSVLLKLRAIHLLRTHLWLQLRQHQQGRLWPYLLFLWRGVQSAGLRQVCTARPQTLKLRGIKFVRGILCRLLSRCDWVYLSLEVSGQL